MGTITRLYVLACRSMHASRMRSAFSWQKVDLMGTAPYLPWHAWQHHSRHRSNNGRNANPLRRWRRRCWCQGAASKTRRHGYRGKVERRTEGRTPWHGRFHPIKHRCWKRRHGGNEARVNNTESVPTAVTVTHIHVVATQYAEVGAGDAEKASVLDCLHPGVQEWRCSALTSHTITCRRERAGAVTPQSNHRGAGLT
jgi:hypothetical protein